VPGERCSICSGAHHYPSCGFLLHSYGSPLELVDSFVELGAYFSFSGYFLNENKKAKLAPFHEIPMDRLLVETDAPAMPLPPERNEFPLPRREDGELISVPSTEGSPKFANCQSRNSWMPFAEISIAFSKALSITRETSVRRMCLVVPFPSRDC
jgi:Tat protein secretion system quality control protein TatD with DNase activity